MSSAMPLCDKTDCAANIENPMRKGKRVCRALIKCLNPCPFYKYDPSGSIQKQIDADIKCYTGKTVKND